MFKNKEIHTRCYECNCIIKKSQAIECQQCHTPRCKECAEEDALCIKCDSHYVGGLNVVADALAD